MLWVFAIHPRERSICDVNRGYRGTKHTRVFLSTWSVCLIVRLSKLSNIHVHLETFFLKHRRYLDLYPRHSLSSEGSLAVRTDTSSEPTVDLSEDSADGTDTEHQF